MKGTRLNSEENGVHVYNEIQKIPKRNRYSDRNLLLPEEKGMLWFGSEDSVVKLDVSRARSVACAKKGDEDNRGHQAHGGTSWAEAIEAVAMAGVNLTHCTLLACLHDTA